MTFLFVECLLVVILGLYQPAGEVVGTSMQPDSSGTSIDSTSRKPAQFILLPIIFSSPDTRLAVGVLPQLVFRMQNSINPSSLRLDAYYTRNRQYHLLFRPNFWLQNDQWNVGGKISFKKWPTSFYGIGNNTLDENQEKFTENLIEASIEANRELIPNFLAGISYGFRHSKIEPDSAGGRLATGAITGSGTTVTSTLGLGFRRDTRDNHFYPTKGCFCRLSFDAALKPLGSDYGFTSITLDLRRYFPLYRSHVLAVQGVFTTTTGKVPFRLLPSVGSMLRGYSTVRYIDRNQIGFQLEYRVVPAAWRVGFVVFGGVAEVFDRFDDLQFENLKYAGGVGLRYQFSRSEKINIRFDYGLGKDSSGDYIDINEAF